MGTARTASLAARIRRGGFQSLLCSIRVWGLFGFRAGFLVVRHTLEVSRRRLGFRGLGIAMAAHKQAGGRLKVIVDGPGRLPFQAEYLYSSLAAAAQPDDRNEDMVEV